MRSREPVVLGVVSRRRSERSWWIVTYQIVSQVNAVLHGPNDRQVCKEIALEQRGVGRSRVRT